MGPKVVHCISGEPCTLLFPSKPTDTSHLWGHTVAQLGEALR